MSTGKIQLSRETIAAAALAIADSEGFHAVSMRRVAQKLGVGTMSLYYYVKTKDDLIGVMDDALMSEALLPSLPKSWKRAITGIATRTHSIFLRHPWALVSMQAAAPGLNAMLHMEQCLEALAQTSMTAKDKRRLLALIDDFVFGHALRETSADLTVDMEFATAQMATGNFPRIAEVFGDGKFDPGDDRFQAGLRLLLREYDSQPFGVRSKTRRSSVGRRKKLK
jgi:AcrR family transcriptional regulator